VPPSSSSIITGLLVFLLELFIEIILGSLLSAIENKQPPDSEDSILNQIETEPIFNPENQKILF